MSMWTLPGQFFYAAGASGTVTIPIGCQIIQVHAHSSGAATVEIFGGDAIPVPSAGWGWQIQHVGWVSGSKGNPVSGDQTIVFTGTDAYFVEYRLGGGV